MASMKTVSTPPQVEYPHSDGKPVGETPEHCDNLLHLVAMLRQWFADDAMTYVAGNSFLYYEEGNPRRHVSPDVFVVRDIPKLPPRRRYLLWEEGKAPDAIIELTSTSTAAEDQQHKLALYRDVLRVQEYFLFDPLGECLEPRLQGFRLHRGKYVPIRRLKGRLPSKVLGLHLEPDDWELRLYDPKANRWLISPPEVYQTVIVQEQTLAAQEQTLAAQEQTLAAERQARLQERLAAEAEIRRLQEELKLLRGKDD
jgi:Uma2 family endonuclease